MRKTGRKILISIISGVLVIAIAAGLLTVKYFRNRRPTVYAASDWVWSDYYGEDASYSYGTVSTEGIQPVNISSTQQVKQIYVTEGQEVHVGDPLVEFDTTLSEIDLERKSIEVQQLELELQQLNTQLAEINGYLVGSDSSYSISYTYSTGTLSYPPYLPYITSTSTVGTEDDPIVYLWDDSCVFNDGFVRQLVQLAMDTRSGQQDDTDNDDSGDDESGEEEEQPAPETDDGSEPAVDGTKTAKARRVRALAVEEEMAEEDPVQDAEPETEPEPEPDPEPDPDYDPEPEPDPDPEPEPDPEPDYTDDRVYAVFEVRDGGALNSTVERCWEIAITSYSDGSWDIRFINPVYVSADEVYTEIETYDYIDTNVYYTAAEVAAAREECERNIQSKSLALETAKVEYERLEYEMQNGTVYSEIDGVVKTVRDADQVQKSGQPLVLVSAGGGYYITASIGEYDLDSVKIGDAVQVTSYEDGMSYTGEVVEISPYAQENSDSWVSGGSTNISWYPMKVFVSEDASLREDSYVEVQYDSNAESGGSGRLYMSNAFIRNEDGESCVYVVGEDGRLERRVVRTGTDSGYYTEILQGLTIDECYDLYIAYLYDGSRIREGAAVQYGTDSSVYYYG